MRILYGVVGEGMGHAIRSRVVLEHLLRAGARGRDHGLVARRRLPRQALPGGAPHPRPAHHLRGEPRAARATLVVQRARRAAPRCRSNIRAYFELVEDFAPRGGDQRLRVVGLLLRQDAPPADPLDRQHADHQPLQARPPEILEGIRAEFELTRAFVKSKLPCCDHYLITTFFYPQLRKERTTLVPPILRPEILAAKPRARRAPARLPDRRGPRRAARGARADAACSAASTACAASSRRTCVEGNLRYRPFDEAALHRRPRARARGDRRRRLHADGRVRVPAQADALGAGRRPVRAGAQRALPSGEGYGRAADHVDLECGSKHSSPRSRATGAPGGAPAGRQSTPPSARSTNCSPAPTQQRSRYEKRRRRTNRHRGHRSVVADSVRPGFERTQRNLLEAVSRAAPYEAYELLQGESTKRSSRGAEPAQPRDRRPDPVGVPRGAARARAGRGPAHAREQWVRNHEFPEGSIGRLMEAPIAMFRAEQTAARSSRGSSSS